MAVTYIRTVRSDPARTIAYAADPEKVMDGLVSGINCLPRFAAEQFRATRRWWRKEGGVLCYHVYQSFPAGEADPEEIHRIGTELASRLWGDRFEVVVATHCNTGHIHNHFVINSVSLADGRKLENTRDSYPRLRRASDEICLEHGLSVIAEPSGRRENYAEREAERNGRPTIRGTFRHDIDAAAARAVTWKGFLRFLRQRGYEIGTKQDRGTGRDVTAFTPPGASSPFTLKSLGRGYSADGIKERILADEAPERSSLKEKEVRIPSEEEAGILGRYIALLEDAWNRPEAYGPVTMDMRKDMIRLDRLREVRDSLREKGISGTEDIAARITGLGTEAGVGREAAELRDAQQILRQAEERAEQLSRPAAEKEERDDRWHIHRTQPSRW